VGRPSTYAPTIKLLMDRAYAEKQVCLGLLCCVCCVFVLRPYKLVPLRSQLPPL
jgi:hypothetical protein